MEQRLVERLRCRGRVQDPGSLLDEHFRLNAGLTEGAILHIARMMGDGGIAARLRIEPDLTRPR